MSDQRTYAEASSPNAMKDLAISALFAIIGIAALLLSWLCDVLSAFQADGLGLLGAISIALGCLSAPSLLRPATMAAVRNRELAARLFVAIAFLAVIYTVTSAVFESTGEATLVPVDGSCPVPASAYQPAPNPVWVTVDRNSLWRPRGAEVGFTFGSNDWPIEIEKLRVCFRWVNLAPNASNAIDKLMPSTTVRAIRNSSGGLQYEAGVPALPTLPLFSDRGAHLFTGLQLVPVAQMIIQATPGSGPPFVTSIEVGVTSVRLALLLTALSLFLMLAILFHLTQYTNETGANWFLSIISDRAGYANLAQFQLVLWTMIIGSSSIFIMVLTGNFVGISSEALVLLGICALPVLLIRLRDLAGERALSAGTADAHTSDSMAIASIRIPVWSDLITVGGDVRDIDLTRIQMLIMTTACALFIAAKVIYSYGQLEIPDGIVLLMGISNGIYAGGRLAVGS